ncbi:hypothetical protein D3H34_07370 [Acidovorax cavernicola]|uniref:Uncharacterized protein n=2 Tax=Acidovorax cavernicola TaxID=1675792 RepID=A0A9X8GWZ4_9BURK|nr:hypothetical protein D3H34_07370 [Acidovorax cavernicola]
MADAYFTAERWGGLMFIVVGAVAIGVAAWTWRHGAFWRGAAVPLVLAALVQLGVGGSVWWRSPQDLARVQHIVANERVRLGLEEIPRMQVVINEFARNHWIEFALVIAGLLLVALAPRGTAWQGAGAALAVQAAVIIFLDGSAERRAAGYLSWLQSL